MNKRFWIVNVCWFLAFQVFAWTLSHFGRVTMAQQGPPLTAASHSFLIESDMVYRQIARSTNLASDLDGLIEECEIWKEPLLNIRANIGAGKTEQFPQE